MSLIDVIIAEEERMKALDSGAFKLRSIVDTMNRTTNKCDF